METLSALGPEGVFTLLLMGLLVAGRNRKFRRELIRSVHHLRLHFWAKSMGMSYTLARKLQRDRWDKIMEQRRFPGLKRGRVSRTPIGIRIRLRFGGSLTHKLIVHRVDQLETALGLVSGTARLKPTKYAHKDDLHIVLRDPLAGDLAWEQPSKPVRLRDPLKLSMTPFGEWVTVDLRNRLGIFGTSGSGKSCMQRLVGAHVIQAIDADLEIWDLKQGLESQHFAGKAHRITDSAEAVGRTHWLLNTEFPRRAAIMKAQGKSSWVETPENPALIVMIDEGNVVTRDFKAPELKKFFTAVEQGRAMGVYFCWVTQFPKSTNLPTELRAMLNIRICLRLESSEESRLVFKDETSEGWEPHKLDNHWMLIKSTQHKSPEESKNIFLSEEVFRGIPLSGSVPDTVVVARPQVDETSPSIEDVPDNLVPWIVRPVSVSSDSETVVLKPVRESLDSRVLSLVKSSDGPIGARDIATRLGQNPGTVHRVLKRLEDVEQTPDKKYRSIG